jgi:NAD(P)H-dependent FMN reductase
MEQKGHVLLGISGSLREQSSNSRLLAAVKEMLPAGTEFRQYEGLGDLPQFNPDLDRDDAEPHSAVRAWREQLREATAVVICTPEYARGVPGSLKNALDWVVSSGEFVGMRTALISASPHPDGGSTALASLALTLGMMSAVIPDNASLAVPFVSKIVGRDGSITDAAVLSSLRSLVSALLRDIPDIRVLPKFLDR